MSLIRERSHAATARARVRAFFVGGALCIATLGTAAAFGTGIYDGVRVWLTGGKATVVVRSLVMVRQPRAADVRNAIAHATFPVVFPVGLPAGTRVNMIMFAPLGRPNSLTVDYRNERANFNVGFALFDSAAINTNAPPPPGVGLPGPVYQWRVGKETVFVPKGHISLAEANRIKAAMMKTSARDSLAATEAALRKIVVLGATPKVADIAERYAPASGTSVFFDPQHLTSARSIAALVQQHRPLLDSRTVYLSAIPNVHGQPDYSKATLRFPKVIVVSADGVRAIDAVLRATAPGGSCGCDILFNQPNSSAYWVWEIPLSASGTAKKYSVDAKTFAVTPST